MAVLSVALVAVAAPHVVFVAYDLEAIDLLESVFVDGDAAAPVFAQDTPQSTTQSTPSEPVLIEVPDPALVAAPIIVTPRSTRNLIFRSGVGESVAGSRPGPTSSRPRFLPSTWFPLSIPRALTA